MQRYLCTGYWVAGVDIVSDRQTVGWRLAMVHGMGMGMARVKLPRSLGPKWVHGVGVRSFLGISPRLSSLLW